MAVRQHRHPLIPRARTPEPEQALMEASRTFRVSFQQLLQRRIGEVLGDASLPAPELRRRWPDLRRQLDACPQIQAAHQRRAALQDQLWATVKAAIADDRQRLEAVADSQRRGPGSLQLTADLAIPSHQLKADIHRMPGGYLNEQEEDGVVTGALYDHGVFLYGQGWFGPLNDAPGRTVIEQVLARHHAGLRPRRILDLGCGAGHSTLPYAAAFPEAEVWGIDLGASLLRYASARARLLDHAVHFAQQDAERTGFGDRSFDLIVSHILLHEIPAAARRRLFAEAHRLLRPQGVMVHLDSALFLRPSTPASRYFRDTEVWVNSEPYLASSPDHAFAAYALEAGFAPDRFQVHELPGPTAGAGGTPQWLAFCARKG